MATGRGRSGVVPGRGVLDGSFWPASASSFTKEGRLRLPIHVGLLGDLERAFYLDTKVSDLTLQLRVPKQKLDRTQILGASVDQGRLLQPHGVPPVRRGVKTNLVYLTCLLPPYQPLG